MFLSWGGFLLDYEDVNYLQAFLRGFDPLRKKQFQLVPTMTSVLIRKHCCVVVRVTSKRRRSAGTLSPTDRQTVSPGTSSLASRCSRLPSLTLTHSRATFT